ncbi:MAG TPA: FAD-dependent oxidoreductase [Anaerolineae bacterium]|nr:FAD-dependent oxidoreductase [Anaerolineae bacterium]
MSTKILILGAGFGGLTAATELRAQLDDDCTITLIDKSDHFIIGFSKFDVLFGRQTEEQVKSYYRDLAADGVNFIQTTIEKIDTDARQVTTQAGTHEYDYLIVALGADVVPAATPGLVEGGHEFYTLPGAAKLNPVITNFTAGHIVVAILGKPYKCPPAPYEAIFQLHDYYTQNGRRDQIELTIVTPGPRPLPVSPSGSDEIERRLAARNINFRTKTPITGIDPATNTALIDGQDPLPYDLFIGIPLHRPPAVVKEAGFGPKGWIPVNAATLATNSPNVYAVGDVTTIPVGQFGVPKAGAFAESGAKIVVQEIVRAITGQATNHTFQGNGTCYLEFGGGDVAEIDANFLTHDAPRVNLVGPNPQLRANKEQFSTSRLEKWFRT